MKFNYSYKFTDISENDLDKINLPQNSKLREQTIKIRNPLNEDYQVMRTTTIPSILTSIATNVNYKNENVGLYDISRTYKNENGAIESGNIIGVQWHPEETFETDEFSKGIFKAFINACKK